LNHDQMVEKVYRNMKSNLPADAFDESSPDFYENLEVHVQAIYYPYFDPDKLHEAIEKFKQKPKSKTPSDFIP